MSGVFDAKGFKIDSIVWKYNYKKKHYNVQEEL